MKREDRPEVTELRGADVVEIELDDLIEIPTDEPLEPNPRTRRWTPHHGVTTQPRIHVGVMLGKRGLL